MLSFRCYSTYIQLPSHPLPTISPVDNHHQSTACTGLSALLYSSALYIILQNPTFLSFTPSSTAGGHYHLHVLHPSTDIGSCITPYRPGWNQTARSSTTTSCRYCYRDLTNNRGIHHRNRPSLPLPSCSTNRLRYFRWSRH